MVFMIDESLRFIFTMFVLTCSGIEGTAAFDCGNPSQAFVTNTDAPLGCAGALWGPPNGNPSKDYCTNTGANANGRFGWREKCCEWVTSTKHSARCEPKQFNCDEDSAHALAYALRGNCAGAMWGVSTNGFVQAPSYSYCTNTGDAHNRYRWHAQCCKWTGTGQCVHKDIDLATWCDDLSNAPVILTAFAPGCAGAVWSGSGAPSISYCQNTAPNTGGRYGWHRHCCVWTGTSCAHRDTLCPLGVCEVDGQRSSQQQKQCEGSNPADEGAYSQQAYCCEWRGGQCKHRGLETIDSGQEYIRRECRVDDHHPSFLNQWQGDDVSPGVVTDMDYWCARRERKHRESLKRVSRCGTSSPIKDDRCRIVPVGIMCSPNKNATLVNRTTTSLRKEQTKPQQLQTKYEWDVTYPSCNRGYWASGCGQPAIEQKGVVRCYGNTLKGSWVDDDAKCTGKKPDATRTCPATAKCPRCKGCKRDGGCWKICGGKAGKCSACDSHDGREGACCRQGAKDDPIECELAEYQFSGEDHTCALLPADDHTGSLMIGIISRLKQLETTIKGMLGL